MSEEKNMPNDLLKKLWDVENKRKSKISVRWCIHCMTIILVIRRWQVLYLISGFSCYSSYHFFYSMKIQCLVIFAAFVPFSSCSQYLQANLYV